MASRHRPRRHRHPERGGARAGEGRHDATGVGTRGFRGAGVETRRVGRRHHPRSAQGDRRVVRLVSHAVHTGRRLFCRRQAGFRATPRGRPRVSRSSSDPLVPTVFDIVIRRRSRISRSGRPAVVHPLPPHRRLRSGTRNGGYHAARDDVRRCMPGAPPRRRTAPSGHRQDRAHPLDRHRHSHRREFSRRAGIWHGHTQGHAGPRRK